MAEKSRSAETWTNTLNIVTFIIQENKNIPQLDIKMSGNGKHLQCNVDWNTRDNSSTLLDRRPSTSTALNQRKIFPRLDSTSVCNVSCNKWYYEELSFSGLCWTLTADQLPHAESRGRGGGGGGGRGLVERTLSVGHVEKVGLRWCGACLTLLSLRQLDTNTRESERERWHDALTVCFTLAAHRHHN